MSVITMPSSGGEPSRPCNMSFSEAAFAYLKTADGMRNLALDTFATIGKWITIFYPNEVISTLSEGVGEAKNWSALAEVPEKVVEMLELGCTSYNELTAENVAQVFNKICAFFATVTTLAEPICQRIYPVTAATAGAFSLVNYGASAVSRTFDFTKSVNEYGQPLESDAASKEESDIQKGEALFNAIAAISDVAAGVLGGLSYASYIVVAPWVIVAIGSNSLVSTLGAQFYPQIHRYSVMNTKT